MRERLSMPFDEWPAEDREQWSRAFRSTGLFDDPGVVTGWRPKTVAQARYGYSRWLQYLRDSDLSILDSRPVDRVTPHRIRDFVANEASRMSAVSVGALLGHLVLALRVIVPDVDWQWLTQIQRRQLMNAKARDKRPLMVRADELVELGHRLMADATSDGVVHDLLAYRDGLMIALLAFRPLRRKNLAEMRLNKHVTLAHAQIRIAFDAEEMKGGRQFEFALPASLVDAFLHYVNEVRPRFPGASGHEFVWCSMKRGALGPDAIYRAIIKRTAVAFEKPVHPHLFRDIAATAVVIDRPDQALLARDLLGHATFETTENHYLHAQSMKAGVHYLALLESRRRPETSNR